MEMDKWFDWLKNHKKLIIGFGFFFIIGIPILIHICFIIPSPFPWMEAKWSAGDVLLYYGSILGFVGTVSLSALALYQNQKIKEESDKREDLLQKMEMKKNSPILKCKLLGCSGCYADIKCVIENISDNPAKKIEVRNFQVFNANHEKVASSKSVNVKKESISAGEKLEFNFVNDGLRGSDLVLQFDVMCQDKFDRSICYRAIKQIENAMTFTTDIKFREIQLENH